MAACFKDGFLSTQSIVMKYHKVPVKPLGISKAASSASQTVSNIHNSAHTVVYSLTVAFSSTSCVSNSRKSPILQNTFMRHSILSSGAYVMYYEVSIGPVTGHTLYSYWSGPVVTCFSIFYHFLLFCPPIVLWCLQFSFLIVY